MSESEGQPPSDELPARQPSEHVPSPGAEWARPAQPCGVDLTSEPLPAGPAPVPLLPWSTAGEPVAVAALGAAPPAAAMPPFQPLEVRRGRASAVPPSGRFDRFWLDVLALVVAIAGGFAGLVGAFVTEFQSGSVGIFLVILGAPVVEEALKPSGLYLLLIGWPYALRNRLHAAFLCAISGAVFGVVESLIYTEIYFPEGGENFVLFRFTVTPAMHALASFLVGFGLSRATLEWAKGERPLPNATRWFFLAGVGLHAAYNTGAIVLSALGMLDFLNE